MGMTFGAEVDSPEGVAATACSHDRPEERFSALAGKSLTVLGHVLRFLDHGGAVHHSHGDIEALGDYRLGALFPSWSAINRTEWELV